MRFKFWVDDSVYCLIREWEVNLTPRNHRWPFVDGERRFAGTKLLLIVTNAQNWWLPVLVNRALWAVSRETNLAILPSTRDAAFEEGETPNPDYIKMPSFRRNISTTTSSGMEEKNSKNLMILIKGEEGAWMGESSERMSARRVLVSRIIFLRSHKTYRPLSTRRRRGVETRKNKKQFLTCHAIHLCKWNRC